VPLENARAGALRHHVDYLVGLAKNKRLNALSAKLQADAATQHQETKEKVRLFGAFQYKAHSWDRQRRVIVKAEHNAHGANPRYVVTNREGEPPGAL
jgi:Uri superfamily endonuclease